MGVSGSFHQIKSEIAREIAIRLDDQKEFDDELINLIEKNSLSDLYLSKWYDELTIILSNKDWGNYDKKDIGFQIIYGGEKWSFQNSDVTLGFITKEQIIRNLEWLKNKELDNESGFRNYYSKLDKEIIDFVEGLTDSTIEEQYENLNEVIDFYIKCQKENSWIVIWIS